MPNWLLPDKISDLLPAQARRVEELRRACLDAARGFGYELLMPPLLEYTDSLLAGAGQDLDLLTFKLTDQLSGKTLGLRADMTPQVARIDAHVLNRSGVARFCYAGSVLHSHVSAASSAREQLQFGAEIYGHRGLEADCESLELAFECLASAGLTTGLLLDLNDVRVLKAILGAEALDAARMEELLQALSTKDRAAVHQVCASQGMPQTQLAALLELLELYGGPDVLERAAARLPQSELMYAALADLRAMLGHAARFEGVRFNLDLADSSGFHYYTASSFKIYAPRQPRAIVRGGRYDRIGSAFGRSREASGFGLYITDLVDLASWPSDSHASSAIRAPWKPDDLALAGQIAALRRQGERVVYALPGHTDSADEFEIDRKLVQQGQTWEILPL